MQMAQLVASLISPIRVCPTKIFIFPPMTVKYIFRTYLKFIQPLLFKIWDFFCLRIERDFVQKLQYILPKELIYLFITSKYQKL